MPAPRYQRSDRPATSQAMREALAEAAILQREMSLVSVTSEEIEEDIADDDDEIVDSSDYLAEEEEEEEEKIYAEILWSQLDSSGS